MAQCQHILYNAYNNIWCEKFALPDWDMFQTDHPWGEYQAAARAISGSPIYFADDYQKVNEKVIKKIALPNGRILRCPKPALLARENLFNNPAKPGRALKITNENRTNSVVGIFNVMVKSETNSLFSLDLIEKYRKNNDNELEKNSDKQFAVYQYKEKELFTFTLTDSKEIHLGIKGFELFTIAEIESGFAPIGILAMFNSGGIIKDLNRKGDSVEIKLLYGGEIGFYSEQVPTRVTMNGNKSLKFEYHEDSKLLKIFVKENANSHITIFF
jgi:raffinose synthase